MNLKTSVLGTTLLVSIAPEGDKPDSSTPSESGSIQDFIVDDNDIVSDNDELTSIIKDMKARAAERVSYVPHETDDEGSVDGKEGKRDEAPGKRKNRKSKFRRMQFMDLHPLHMSHHIKVLPDAEWKVANFVSGMLPCKDKGDREYYCLTMLVLFRPWRSGTDLKQDDNTSWDTEFGKYTFSTSQEKIMANFNLRYECLDARDDYRAELIQSAGEGLSPGLAGDELDMLIREGDQQMVSDDFADFGIDPYATVPTVKLGRKQKAREAQAAIIRRLMGPVGCMWSTAVPEIADLSSIHVDINIAGRSWSSWKEEIAQMRQFVLNARRSGDLETPKDHSKKPRSRYIDQVEVIHKSHLVRSLHDETEEIIMSEIGKEYSLNAEQERAFRIVAQHSANPMAEQLRMYVGGMGGTGKTRVLNALTAYFRRQGESRRLITVAPTGTAAALVKGSTYHFMFGINESQRNTMSKKSMAEVKDRLAGVNYVFLDEVSMLSCADLYKISSRLAVILNKSDVPFGGMNMIFAGDFAQLPPAIGGEAASLYGPCDGMHASSPRSQEMAMGKAIWHQITTVVILRENMRQRTQTLADEKLRTALENMRYKAATKADIAFLQSKVAGKPTAAKITDKEFRNVSIITGLNVHKDEYNRIGAIRFAEETGQELTMFYSDDKLSASENDGRTSRSQGSRSNVQVITPRLRELLWSASPSANDKQIPPILSLCKGMPVMIRTNSATELCITKGQEATVYAWTEGTGSHGKRILEVLFVSLVCPPSEVQVPGLPPNVVPIIRSSVTVVCSLPDDTTIKLSRTEVEVITNFSMTDFASQGKTRPYNLVDLNNCRTHQSYYTALSRTATAEGTLILPALDNFRASPIDHRKIQGGCSGRLRQEFRELEMLDDITLRMYKGTLPVTVIGDTRYSLIRSFQDYIGADYTPYNMDEKLMWSAVDPFEMVDATDLRWVKSLIAHTPNRSQYTSSKPSKPDVQLGIPSLPNSSNDLPGVPRKVTPMKASEKRKGRASDTFDLKQTMSDKRAAITTGPVVHPSSTNIPVGCKWSNNSCAYDVVLFVLYNLWTCDDGRFAAGFAELHNKWLDMATSSFKKYTLGHYSLEDVRDYLRRALHREYPSIFVFGRNTSVEALLMKLLHGSDTFSSEEYRCQCGQVTPISTQQCCVVIPHSTAPLRWNTLQQFFDNTRSVPVSTQESLCVSCNTTSRKCTTYNTAPPVIAMAVAFIDAPPDETIDLTTNEGPVRYRLVGVVYFGNSHFTARYVDPESIVWFNDGMIQGRRAAREGLLNGIDMRRDPNSKEPDAFVYKRCVE